MTYSVSSGTLNSTIPYHVTIQLILETYGRNMPVHAVCRLGELVHALSRGARSAGTVKLYD